MTHYFQLREDFTQIPGSTALEAAEYATAAEARGVQIFVTNWSQLDSKHHNIIGVLRVYLDYWILDPGAGCWGYELGCWGYEPGRQ